MLIKELEHVFADTFALYVKTLNYHWNVEGTNFMELHLLFERQYTELALASDLLAEQIRTLEAKAKASFSHFEKNSDFKEPNENLSAKEMLKDLHEDHVKICICIKQAQKIANNEGNIGTEDLMVERLRYHEKTAWMLRSYL